jgi:hypothetical protein
VVSATDPYDRILGFLDRQRHIYIKHVHMLTSVNLDYTLQLYQAHGTSVKN